MPLKTIPDPVDYASLLQSTGLNPATGTTSDAGDTSPPQGAAAPNYRIECTPSGGQFTARVIIDGHADEGSNTSIYLKEGVYETNYTLYQQLMEKDKKRGELKGIASYLEAFGQNSANRVYLYMPADVADLNRQAETEHCQDLAYAYQQTLAVFQARLASAQPATGVSGAAAADRLRADLTSALPEARRHLGLDPAKWLEEYTRLCQLTGIRDENLWHHFGLILVEAVNVPNARNPMYLTGNSRDSEKVAPIFLKFTGGQTQIGNHSSAEIIS